MRITWQWRVNTKLGTYLTCTDDHLHRLNSPHVGPLDQQRFLLRYLHLTQPHSKCTKKEILLAHHYTSKSGEQKMCNIWPPSFHFHFTPHSIVLLPFVFYNMFLFMTRKERCTANWSSKKHVNNMANRHEACEYYAMRCASFLRTCEVWEGRRWDTYYRHIAVM